MNAVPTLPIPAASSEAKLPQLYVAARTALDALVKVDECKEWTDKAAALTAYARMARDGDLHRLALQVQARAERKLGQLLKETPSARGSNLENVVDIRTGGREQAAQAAGISEGRATRAKRIASIPEKDFEELVEAPEPPSVTALAQVGTQKREPTPQATIDLPPSSPRRIAWADRLHEMAELCRRTSVETVTAAPFDRAEVLADAEAVSSWATDLYSQLALT